MHISFDELYARNLQKFLCKTCAICFLMSWAFKKTKHYQNLTTESGSKQKFSLLQEKVVIQAVCLQTQAACIKPSYRRKGRTINILKNSTSTVSDQFFLRYVKKTTKYHLRKSKQILRISLVS